MGWQTHKVSWQPWFHLQHHRTSSILKFPDVALVNGSLIAILLTLPRAHTGTLFRMVHFSSSVAIPSLHNVDTCQHSHSATQHDARALQALIAWLSFLLPPYVDILNRCTTFFCSVSVAKQRLRWLGHVFRVFKDSPMKLLFGQVKGRHLRGRPRQSFDDIYVIVKLVTSTDSLGMLKTDYSEKR